MARDKIYRLRLNEDERAALDTVTDQGGFSSVAAFVRDAVERAQLRLSEHPQHSEQCQPDRRAP